MSDLDPAASTTRVLVLRHGESESNLANVWSSARGGNPLTPTGVAQARAAGERLQDAGIDVLYGSPLVRATQTAQEVGGVIGLPAAVLEGVQEFDIGVYEGAHEDVILPIALVAFEAWLADGDLEHGYEGGETGRDVVTRMRAALDAVADAHPGQTVAVVSHGGAMLLGLIVLCDNLGDEFTPDLILHNLDVVEIERVDGRWNALAWAGRPVMSRV